VALTDIPSTFQPDDEEEVRIAIALYFRELGFETTEMSFEDKFSIQLGHTSLELGVAPKRTRKNTRARTRVAGRSDLLLARHGQPLAIIETKAPDHALTEKDALQAISYARLLVDMAPYAIVTNGQETRVYDTFARSLDILAVPTESRWYQRGQQVLSLGDDLRDLAAQTLVGINAQTLLLFCQKQVSTALEDLKGTVYERKPYIPEAFVPRLEVSSSLATWLTTSQPCFALIGDAGMGKTTLLCAVAEEYLAKDYFVLFYSASALKENLEAAIRNDFTWEFHRERGLAHIVERFDEVSRRHGKTLLLILDALDRFPGKREQLKAELLDLIPRLRGRSIRLCLSCKSLDWSSFIIDNTRSLNKLAASLYPLLPPQQTPSLPKIQDIGTWLYPYTEVELDAVFANYQRLFRLLGHLYGMLRQACHDPLILRLLAEVYNERKEMLPQTLSQQDIFERYWEMQISSLKHSWEAEQWLIKLAKICTESRKRQVSLAELRSHLTPSSTQEETYANLRRMNLITVTTKSPEQPSLAFTLDPFLSYVYALKANDWTEQVQQGSEQAVASALCQLLSDPTGVEVVLFYLRIVDQGKTRLMTDMALRDIVHFVQLLEILPNESFVSTTPTDESHQQAVHDHLTQFILAYSELFRTYFPDLWNRIEPYTKDEVGLWLSSSPGEHTYQFRCRTTAHPEPLLLLSPKEAQLLWPVPRSQQIREQVQPYGDISQILGDPEFVHGHPQKTAWQRLLSQVAHLFVTRSLNENHAQALLEERIWHTLLYEPQMFFGEISITGPYWQVLGFSTPEAIPSIAIEEILHRVQALFDQYRSQLMSLFRQYGHLPVPPESARWYGIYIPKLRRLSYCLQQLQKMQTSLQLLSWDIPQLFEYLKTGDLRSTCVLIQELLPSIFRSYRSLVQENLSVFADHLALYTHQDASFLIEVIPEPAPPGLHSDHLQIIYALLPSVCLPEKYLVYTCQEEDSLGHIPFRYRTLEGHQAEYPSMPGFGKGTISRTIEGVTIEEPDAFFYITTFPSHYPVLDQVYQLLGNELFFLLQGKFRDWLNNDSGKINDVTLDLLIERLS
jgi:hypothetical protein